MKEKRIFNNILETIGDTPLVKLNRLAEGVDATVLVKIEYFNPGGSIKDRIGISMIEAAEKKGLIKPGYTLVEPTSGNTGLGLALAATVKGYKIIFTIPDKMSIEKINLLKAFGAKVIVTPTDVPPDHPNGYVKVAERIAREEPETFMLNQYYNPANPEIHYKTTGPEIWDQTDGNLDVVVAGVGTGGTISGIGKYLKEKNPGIRIVGADPEGSIYHHEFVDEPAEIHSYLVEGIGEDFMPGTLDMKVIDEIIVVSDKDAFFTTRRLAMEEGIFVGGSAGAAVHVGIQVAKQLDKGQTVVVILPDTGRSYITKIFSDDWMREKGFLETEGERIHVQAILDAKKHNISKIISIKPDDSIQSAISLMVENGISQLPVMEGDVAIGSVSEQNLVEKFVDLNGNDKQLCWELCGKKIKEVMELPLPSVNKTDSINNPLLLLKNSNAMLVIDEKHPVDIITMTDVINYFMGR